MSNDSCAAAQKNYADNVAAIEAILRRERSYVFEIPYGEDVVALLSGGLDSTMMVDLVVDEWKCRVHPLYVRRGARADRWEERAFDHYCTLFRERFGDRFADPVKLAVEVPPLAFKTHYLPERLHAVGHPMRNATLQNLAVMAAVAIRGGSIRTIFSGSVADDGTGPELGLLGLRVQTLSTCVHLGEWTWQITSPMIEPIVRSRPMTKRDLIHRARERGIPLEFTRSCFGPDKAPCGTCTGCVKRCAAEMG